MIYLDANRVFFFFPVKPVPYKRVLLRSFTVKSFLFSGGTLHWGVSGSNYSVRPLGANGVEYRVNAD